MKRCVLNSLRAAARTAKVVLGVLLLTAALPERAPAACEALHWIVPVLNPANQTPPGRYAHAMAYDSFHGVSILFGGLDTNDVPLGDTWLFDVHGWRQLHPPHSPSARFRHALSYDASRGVIVLFGGRDLGQNYQDLWEWNGTDWKSVEMDGEVPAARHWHGLAFDSTRGRHVLFGGFLTGPQEAGDTWEYDPNARQWTLRASTGPGPRHGMSLAFDRTHNQMLLFGGYDSTALRLASKFLSDTWVWDGASGVWVLQSLATVPQGRAYYSLAYDSLRSVILMQNGQVDFDEAHTATVSDSWEWNGTDWRDRSSSYHFHAPRLESAMVYDLETRRMIMFSGDGAYPEITWSLEPIWTAVGALQVDYRTDGSFPGVYKTFREALATADFCTFIRAADGDYNETGSGQLPLVITKPVQIYPQRYAGDPFTAVRIH